MVHLPLTPKKQPNQEGASSRHTLQTNSELSHIRHTIKRTRKPTKHQL